MNVTHKIKICVQTISIEWALLRSSQTARCQLYRGNVSEGGTTLLLHRQSIELNYRGQSFFLPSELDVNVKLLSSSLAHGIRGGSAWPQKDGMRWASLSHCRSATPLLLHLRQLVRALHSSALPLWTVTYCQYHQKMFSSTSNPLRVNSS